MWTAPCLQGGGAGFWIGSLASICPACWMRSRMTAGQDGFRGGSSTQSRDVMAPLDCTDCLPSRIDRSHHLLVLLQGPASARCERSPSRPADFVSGSFWRYGHRALGVVGLAARHQLPGDARRLVGERHGGELGRLALQQRDEPGRRPVPRRTCQMTAVAPTTSRLRKVSSPARVITPGLTLLAVE